jgi:3-hydroxy acid dehydrogenase / malonic semialdehyde reductase
MSDWSDTTVLVTGATAGFGQAIARRFAALGARVVGTGRRAERLEALRAELGSRFLPLVFDVRDRAAVEAALGSLSGAFARVDVLVNNAGLALGLDPVWKADPDDWEAMVRTNVDGVLHCTRALLPGMVERRRGHVVNLSSVAASWPYPGGHVYAATKAFVTQLSLAMRCDLVGTGVRVTSIEPGLAETEFSLVRFKGDSEAARRPYSGVEPLVAEDIAEAVVWAVSQPRHVNVNRIEIMATEQAWGPFAIHRGPAPG